MKKTKNSEIADDLLQIGKLLKEIVKENKMSKHFTEVFVEKSNDIIFIIDIETNKIIYANERAKKVYEIKELDIDYRKVIKLPKIIFTKKEHTDAIYSAKLNKVLHIDSTIEDIDNKSYVHVDIRDLNGETKVIVNLANKHNIV